MTFINILITVAIATSLVGLTTLGIITKELIEVRRIEKEIYG